METTVLLIIAFLVGAWAGFLGWHFYYMDLLPLVIRKFGYKQRSKRKRQKVKEIGPHDVD